MVIESMLLFSSLPPILAVCAKQFGQAVLGMWASKQLNFIGTDEFLSDFTICKHRKTYFVVVARSFGSYYNHHLSVLANIASNVLKTAVG